jgi:hypothetical protein
MYLILFIVGFNYCGITLIDFNGLLHHEACTIIIEQIYIIHHEE